MAKSAIIYQANLPKFCAVLFLIFFSLFTSPEPAHAQDEIICTAIAVRWSGTPAEVERIKIDPVPPSFLASLRGDFCIRWQLTKSSLVSWHIKHGDEESARAALEFWEKEFRTDLDGKFVGVFRDHWDKALVDVERIFVSSNQENPDWPPQNHRNATVAKIRELASINKLNGLNERVDSAEFVATEYLRAADAFQSISMLNAAKKVDGTPRLVAEFLDKKLGASEAEELLAIYLDNFSRSDRYSAQTRAMKLAILEASIHRDPASISEADNVTRSIFSPAGIDYPWPDLLTFLRQAYENGAEGCSSYERNSLKNYRDRCESYDFENFAARFWFERTRLELIAKTADIAVQPLNPSLGPGRALEMTVDLFLRRAWNEDLRYGEIDAPAEPVRLLIWAGRAEAANIDGNCDAAEEQGRAIYAALSQIVRAGSLTSASNSPGLYREYATALVETYETFENCSTVSNEPRFARANINAKAFLANNSSIK